jgi:predicted nucleotidyltransferase
MPTENEINVIQSHLLDYADAFDGRILGARDYGSRARNLESDSSDYDVFFVYAQRPARYAIGSDTDTYNKSVDTEIGEVELHGWSLKKFIGGDGLSGSNPTALEYVMSPEEYIEPVNEPFEELVDQSISFKPYALINHYRSMAASNYGKYVEQSWIREWSQEQFADYANTPAGQTRIEESRGVVTIGILGYDEHTVEIPLDKATANGMIRRTTVDPTVKRYNNIAQALVRARHVEETHELPLPMDFEQFLKQHRNEEWLPNMVFEDMISLCRMKQAGHGSKELSLTVVDDWIESELDRTVEPHDHVNQTPDAGAIRMFAKMCYRELY